VQPLGLALVFFLLSGPLRAEIPLPTPLDHYRAYQPREQALVLLSRVLAESDEATRSKIAAQLAGTGRLALDRFSDAQLVGALQAIGWNKWRGEILELLLHNSSALEVLPASTQQYLPAVHDSLLLFLDRLSEDRLLERLAQQARLPADASRRDRLLAFVAKTPTLQKLGQILARNPSVDPELRGALQRLENSVSTMSREEVVAAVEGELGPEVLARYEIRFADRLLAEASVGAVIAASFVPPGREHRERAVCKVLKPHAVAGLRQELSIMDEVLAHLEAQADFYRIGATPLVEMFQEVREALSREILVDEEQANLVRAAAYYRGRGDVLIPAIFPFSTPNLTCMEYVEGEKITEAFPGDVAARRKLARRFSDLLTFDVIFSAQGESLFHGDPHAGNVFHVRGDKDPYRIALLDWGLCGVLEKEQRAGLVQLLVGLYLRDSKRLANNLNSLVDWGPKGAPDQKTRRALAERVLKQRGRKTFELLNDLAGELAREGYALRFHGVVFVKAQLTLYGILKELDPDFKQDAHLMKRVSGQVWRELPARLGRTLWFPAWNSPDYPSLLSNEDVKDIQVQRLGRALKKVGKGIWTGLTLPAKLFPSRGQTRGIHPTAQNM
jgi:ubiquinone biosynthesis protein